MSDQQTKDMSTLMEVAKLLGQIGTAGAALYVGAGAARDTYDALKAKCREMMDKLDEAQSQLDNIDPQELDNGKAIDMTAKKGLLDRVLAVFGNAGAIDRNNAAREIAALQRERDEMRATLERISTSDHYSDAWAQAQLVLMDGIRELDNAISDAQIALDNEERSDSGPREEKGDVLQFPDMGQIQMINALINDAEGIDDPNGTIAVALHDSVYRAERLAMDRGEDLLGFIARAIRILNAASTGPDCAAETALHSGLYAGRDYFKAAPAFAAKSFGAHNTYR